MPRKRKGGSAAEDKKQFKKLLAKTLKHESALAKNVQRFKAIMAKTLKHENHYSEKTRVPDPKANRAKNARNIQTYKSVLRETLRNESSPSKENGRGRTTQKNNWNLNPGSK
jgi:hypothetical protein